MEYRELVLWSWQKYSELFDPNGEMNVYILWWWSYRGCMNENTGLVMLNWMYYHEMDYDQQII